MPSQLFTDEERRALPALLDRIVGMAEPGARLSLLDGLPYALQLAVPLSEDSLIHLTQIVETVDSPSWAQLVDGSWAGLRVLANALRAAQDSPAAAPVATLLAAVQARLPATRPVLDP